MVRTLFIYVDLACPQVILWVVVGIASSGSYKSGMQESDLESHPPQAGGRVYLGQSGWVFSSLGLLLV